MGRLENMDLDRVLEDLDWKLYKSKTVQFIGLH